MATKLLSHDQVPGGLMTKFLKNVADRIEKGEPPKHWVHVFNAAGEVIGISNPAFGKTETKYQCEVDPETGEVLAIKFSGQIRENGAIDPDTGFGTPSVFFTPIRMDKKGNVLLGLTTEQRPVLRQRLLVRPNGKYLDLRYKVRTYKKMPGDTVVLLPDREDGLEWVDHRGEVIDKIVHRYGVEVLGVPGGYGATGVNDLESAALEIEQEGGIIGTPQVALTAWPDRAWAPVPDLHGFVIVTDESQVGNQNIGDHEEIAPGLTWIYADEFDIRLCPDKHCLVSIMSVYHEFGLVGRKPTERPWNKDAAWWN